MNRRDAVKSLAVLPMLAGAGALGLVRDGDEREVVAELHFQQDPPSSSQWANQVMGMCASGDVVTVDLSEYDPAIKIVFGYLYVRAKGIGTWLIETKPVGVNPAPVGWQWVHSHYADAHEVGFEMSARCNNASLFKLRITREGTSEIEWAFAPVWWWS